MAVPAKVNRLGPALLLLLVGATPLRAQTPIDSNWDPALASAVYTTALAFMAPRILEPVALSQLTLWGLRGLTALDPALAIELRDGQLVLLSGGSVLAAIAPPAVSEAPPVQAPPKAWADLAVALAGIARDASPTVRRAGTAGVLRSFFDELFNHLDPYSRYVPPTDAAEDRARRSGRAGAGVTLISQNGASQHGTVIVASVIADGPGALAGLRPGDRVVSVDGQSSAGQSAAIVAGWIEGPEDTTVQITLSGRGARAREVEILRALVPPETVFAERRGEIFLLRVTGFNNRTDARLTRELERGTARLSVTGARPAAGIVIDLRGNRGGLVREAVAVADEWLPAGIVAIAAGRNPEADRIWRSFQPKLLITLPVVVLVDGRSASAAEIVAAALADRGRAVVVGSVTQGKGLVQTIAQLPDGGELFVTWSRLLAPLGWPIQGLGVLPQVCTSLGADNLQRQLANLANGNQLMADALTRHREARAPIPPAQALAIRATCPAAEGRDGDMEAAKFLIGHSAAYARALMPTFTGLPP